jgi:tetratricopeptide (TPR) repeat protein
MLGWLIELAISVPADSLIRLVLPRDLIRGLIYAGLGILWGLAWVLLRSVLKGAARGRIGVVLCVDTDGSPAEATLRADFVARLQRDIEQTGLADTMQLIVPNPAQCQAGIRILSSTRAALLASDTRSSAIKSRRSRGWSWLAKGTHGRFFIWGTVRKRQDGDKQVLWLQLDAVVTHAPLDSARQRILAAEFGSVWPSRFSIDCDHAFAGADLTADWIASTSEYLIGLAALASGDPSTALVLHSRVATLAMDHGVRAPQAIQIMQQHARNYVVQEAFVLAWRAWRREDAPSALSLLSQALHVRPDSVSALSLRGIIEWALLHDTEKAIQTTLEAKKYSADKDGTWRYNLAFLLLEKGQYEESLSMYKKTMAKSFNGEGETLRQVVEFLEDCIAKQPDVSTRHFALALILYKKRQDLPGALVHFTFFISSTVGNQGMAFLRERALSYRSEIEEKLRLLAKKNSESDG